MVIRNWVQRTWVRRSAMSAIGRRTDHKIFSGIRVSLQNGPEAHCPEPSHAKVPTEVPEAGPTVLEPTMVMSMPEPSEGHERGRPCQSRSDEVLPCRSRSDEGLQTLDLSGNGLHFQKGPFPDINHDPLSGLFFEAGACRSGSSKGNIRD